MDSKTVPAVTLIVKFCRIRNIPGWDNGIAVFGACDFRAESPQTISGGIHIPAGFGTMDLRRFVGKGSTDQKPVCLGFGGYDVDITPERPGMDQNIHIKDLP